MADLMNTLAYLLQAYPHKDDLSNARATKLVYLADWHQAINYKQQMTQVAWYFDNYGPFVWDVLNTARANPNLFSIQETSNYYGTPKTLLSRTSTLFSPILSRQEQTSLQHVILATQRLGWDDFIKLVYSTYPIASSPRYSYLNLVQKAAEYAILNATPSQT